MNCSSCGSQIETEDKICNNCKKEIVSSKNSSFLPPEPDYDDYTTIKRKKIEELEEKNPGRNNLPPKSGMLWRKNPSIGEWLSDISFIHPGNRIAVGLYSGEVLILNLENGTVIKYLREDVGKTCLLSAQSTCIAVSPNGKLLAQGFENGLVTVRDLSDGDRMYTFENHRKVVTRLYFHDNSLLLSGSGDQFIVCRDLSSGIEKFRLRGDDSTVMALVSCRKRDIVYCGTEKGSIFTWKMENMSKVMRTATTREAHREGIMSLSVSPCENLLVSSGADGIIRLWKIGMVSSVSPEPVDKVEPCEQSVTGGSLLGDIVFKRSLLARTLFKKILNNKTITAVEFSPVQPRIVSGGCDGLVRIWDVTSMSQVTIFPESGSAIRCVGYSPDGQYVVGASEDCLVTVWKV
jgi:WD40 repeat protein